MLKKMILLFSHNLTQSQIAYAKDHYGVNQFVNLPYDLQKLWSNINPDSEKIDMNSIKEFVKQETNNGDYALIQGDFGACYTMANFCKSLGVIPVYATTKRIASEYVDEDGKTVKKSIFEFRRFREYG